MIGFNKHDVHDDCNVANKKTDWLKQPVSMTTWSFQMLFLLSVINFIVILYRLIYKI